MLILLISWDVRKPSKKFMNGTDDRRVAMCEISAISIDSCTLWPDNMAKPVCLVAITSVWSPKIHRACFVTERAATWNTAGFKAPAIIYMLGIISKRPCDDVKVVANDPTSTTPWHAPAAPASLCIWVTFDLEPNKFFRPCPAQFAITSPIGVAGVIG